MKRTREEAEFDPDSELEDLSHRIEEIEKRVKEGGAAAGWKRRLEMVEEACKMPLYELEEEGRKTAAAVYGAKEADWYRPEPESVATLTALSTRAPSEEALARETERLCSRFQPLRKRLLALVTDAKAAENQEDTRRWGRALSAVGKLLKRLQGTDALVGKRLHAANRRLSAYRERIAVRAIDPANLSCVTPDAAGYAKILDFYRHSDTKTFSFGRQLTGAQHYTDVRRNVAILSATVNGEEVFNAYAVSGEGAPASSPAPPTSRFASSVCVDGLGESYDRRFDAEFKLVALFASSPASTRPSKAVLWSRKPLCKSCSDVLLIQFPKQLPHVELTVIIGEGQPGDVVSEVREG